VLISQKRHSESVAYAFARAGDIPQAIRELDKLIAMGKDDGDEAWRSDHADAVSLRSLLLSDPKAAQSQLLACEEQTVRALGLERFRSE
jgi:hypothetical protein